MTVEEFLAPHSPEVQALAQEARQLIKSVAPQAQETVRPGRNSITFEAGSKMAEWVCYIAPFQSRINIGLFRGTALPDPQGLMEGTGESLRHVKIKSSEDLHKPALRELLEAAFKTHP